MWSEFVEDLRYLEILSFVGVLFLAISFYTSSYVSILGIILVIIGYGSLLYFKKCQSRIEFINEKNLYRFVMGEEGKITLPFSYNGRFPIFQAELLFSIDTNVGIKGGEYDELNKNQSIKIPLILQKGTISNVSVDIEGKKRGVATIRNLQVIVYGPFGMGRLFLKYKNSINHEIIVYPKDEAVANYSAIKGRLFEGNFPVQQSLYVDNLAIIGTRDYTSHDNFLHIHWKATAKTGTLQTKIFQPSVKQAWTVIVNIREPDPNMNYHISISYLEELVSSLTFLLKQAERQQIEYELFSNVAMKFGSSVYHLQGNDGRRQLISSLEFLARIQNVYMSVPSTSLLQFVKKNRGRAPVILYCGPYSQDDLTLLTSMKLQGYFVFHLGENEGAIRLCQL